MTGFYTETPDGHKIHINGNHEFLSIDEMERLQKIFDQVIGRELNKIYQRNIALNRMKAIYEFANWLEDSGAGGSYSDFCNDCDFGYTPLDGEDRGQSYDLIVQAINNIYEANKISLTCQVADIERDTNVHYSQWRGATNQGMEIFIKYRDGILVALVGDKQVYKKQFGDSYSGSMTDAQMMHYLSDIFVWNKEGTS